MPLTATAQSDFEQCPTGNHIARCVSVIDIGTQRGEYKGQVKMQRKVIIGFEIPDKKMEDGRPFTISSWMTLSLVETANLRSFLAAWRGRDFTEEELVGFDVDKLLDVPCLLNVIDKKGKSKIDSASPLPSSMSCPARVNDLVFFNTEDPTTYHHKEKFGNGLIERIESSPEWAEAVSSGDAGPIGVPNNKDLDDDVPF